MVLSKNLQAEVKRLTTEKAKTITAEELFQSVNFREYLEKLALSMTEAYTKPPELVIHEDGSDGATVGCTDGDKVFLNTANVLVRQSLALETKFMIMLGIFCHEIAHILFMDFDGTNKGFEAIKSGKFFGKRPTPGTADERATLAELIQAMADPQMSEIFVTLYHNIVNCVQDAHDEAAIKRRFGSLVRNAIDFNASAIYYHAAPLEKFLDGDTDNLTIMVNCILQMARYGEVFMTEPETRDGEIMQKVFQIAPAIYNARETDSTRERFTYINQIVLCLWPYIKELLEQQQQQEEQEEQQLQGGGGSGEPDQSKNSDAGNGGNNGSGNNGTDSPEITQKQVDAVMDALKKAAQNAGCNYAAPAPVSRKTTDIAKAASRANNKTDGQQDAGENGIPYEHGNADIEVPRNVMDALSQLVQAMALGQAQQEAEESMAQALIQQVMTMDDITSSHKGIPVKIARELTVEQKDKDAYKKAMAELSSYSKRLQREMKDALRDLKAGYTQHNRLFGRKLDANRTYRLDSRCYANKKAPQDLPDMAVTVLVDESGSMRGSRRDMAMKAAMLLYDFCMGLGISVHVAGHHTDGETVCYEVFSEFDSVSGNDRYRLAKINASGSNRDRLAIEVSASLLAKRPEDVRLMFVICDGLPNHTKYSGASASKDVADIVKKYRRKGIEVIGAAIGDDQERIKTMYTDSCLDISDVSKLPKTIVSLVKKRIKRYI